MTDWHAVFGSAMQCRACIGGFVEAGVNLPIVFPFGPDAAYHPSLQRIRMELGPDQ
jgi:hypothetical protein